MAFKGDTSQISLTNIFQTLQLNRQEGVMTVTCGKVRRKIRVVPGGVRLVALNRDNPDVLREVLVKQKIVTEAQFQNIISTMGQSTAFPGEFLIQRRILTPERVQTVVAKQLQEFIYEVFSWKKAKYEFVGGDPGDELELFDPAGLGKMLVFNVHTILMEAARREDEWQRIISQAPSEREIFTPVNPAAFLQPRSYDGDADESAIEEVKRLIDGQHTIEAVINESTLSAFEVFQVVALFLAEEEIRPLTVKEKRELADEFRKKFKTQEVIEIYRNLLLSEPQDVDIRLKLVGLLEKRKDKETALILLDQFQSLAEHYYEAREFPAAVSYLKRVLEVDSSHLGALDKLFDIHYLSKEHKEALAVARRIVDAVKSKKDWERGTEILLKVVDLYSGETFLFHELADFFIFANQAENAVSCLKSVAGLYETRGDLVRLRKTYERIAAIDPSQAPALRKIAEAERRAAQPARPRVKITGRLGWTLAAALVLLALGYLVTMEVLARRAYATVQEDVKTCIEGGDFGKAKAILDEIAQRFPWTTLRGQIAVEAGNLESRRRAHEAVRRKDQEKENLHIGSVLAKLESLMSGKRYIEALSLIRESGRETLNEANRKRLQTMEAEILKYFNAADELLARAKEMIQGGKFEEGHRQYLRLMETFPSTPAAKGLRLPLLVKSAPPAAKVTLNGEVAGLTPMVLYYDPLARFALSVSKEGFRPVQLGSIDFTKDWMAAVKLERIPAWVFDAKSPVDCTPLALGKRVYFGTRNGKYFCLDQATGTERWAYTVPDGWDVATGSRAYRDRIAFGTFDGTFHILDAESGRPLHRLVPASPPRPIRSAASEATEEGLVVVNCNGSAVVGINLNTGQVIWTYRAESEALGPPELHGDSVLVATVEGVVHRLDTASGALVRRLQVGGRLQVHGLAASGSYFAGDSTGRIRRIDIGTGQVQWTYESPMESLTPPAIGGNLVFFGNGDGLFAALSLENGDLKWRGKVHDTLILPATWHKRSFYLATRAGQGVSLDGATGSLSWSFATGAPCGAPPGTAGSLIIFPCDDHRLYAFDEN